MSWWFLLEIIRLLIIEKNPKVRQALAARLNSYPQIEVLAAAATATDGLRQNAKHAPDVVLLDAKTAGRPQDLSRVVRAMREQPTRVIILTSYADEIEREAVLQAGARRYLLKDIDSASLIGVIEESVDTQVRSAGCS